MGEKIYRNLLIFDFDGTLVDSKYDLANSLNFALRQLGKDSLPYPYIFSQVGNGATSLLREAVGMDGDSRFEEGVQIFLEHYEEHLLDTTKPYEGVCETLKDESDHFTYALLTNKPLYLTEIIMEPFDLSSHFSLILGGDSSVKKKPDPSGVFKILDDTGFPKESALIIGDSINDVLAGQRAGIEVVGARYGIGPHDFVSHPPNYCIDTFPELFDLVFPR